MSANSPSGPSAGTVLRERDAIDARYKWKLTDIFADWDAWQAGFDTLGHRIDEFAALKGTLHQGGAQLLRTLKLRDEVGQLTYRVWYFASLWYDQDQRDNAINARRQHVQILFAKEAQASAWFNPELLTIPLATVQAWMAADAELAVYRFDLEDLYRQQEHVLNEQGEELLSNASRFSGTPTDAYSALSTADAKFPTLTLSDGSSVTLTYGQYRALLATNRVQADRGLAYREFHALYAGNVNTYASIYNSVLQRDWFFAQSRGYETMLDMALHGNAIPTAVVENLIATTRAGVEPLQRYHRLRKRVLGVASYHPFDTAVPLTDVNAKYPYDDVLEWLVESVERLGPAYQQQMREGLNSGWIDVYENPGKRSGAYSAPVYGVHPYMLLNYNDTLDAVFTLAHEVGHSMHTVLSHQHQPFVYAGYTIFVAEVPSTLNEALFLEFMLARATSPGERAHLLQHAIDDIVSTFYTQVMFADFELQAHRLVEQGQPVTADVLGDLYASLLQAYHGDAIEYDSLARVTWARIPHFFSTPYYVYQYATCFASTAALMKDMTSGSPAQQADAVDRYLTLLKSGGSDHPMTLLKRAGVDLSQRETVQAVVDHLDRLVARLEVEIAALR